jgi:hypothetical protein
VFDEVKGLLKVQFKNNNFSSRLITLVKILKCPPKTILDSLAFDEPILILMHNLQSNRLESTSEQFGNHLWG